MSSSFANPLLDASLATLQSKEEAADNSDEEADMTPRGKMFDRPNDRDVAGADVGVVFGPTDMQEMHKNSLASDLVGAAGVTVVTWSMHVNPGTCMCDFCKKSKRPQGAIPEIVNDVFDVLRNTNCPDEDGWRPAMEKWCDETENGIELTDKAMAILIKSTPATVKNGAWNTWVKEHGGKSVLQRVANEMLTALQWVERLRTGARVDDSANGLLIALKSDAEKVQKKLSGGDPGARGRTTFLEKVSTFAGSFHGRFKACIDSADTPPTSGVNEIPVTPKSAVKTVHPHEMVIHFMRERDSAPNNPWYQEFGESCVKAHGATANGLWQTIQSSTPVMRQRLLEALGEVYQRLTCDGKSADLPIFTTKKFQVCGDSACKSYVQEYCNTGATEAIATEAAAAEAAAAEAAAADDGAATNGVSAGVHYEALLSAISVCFLLRWRLWHFSQEDDGRISNYMNTLFIRSPFFRERTRRIVVLLVHCMARCEKFDLEELALPDDIFRALGNDVASKERWTQCGVSGVWRLLQSSCATFFARPLEACFTGVHPPDDAPTGSVEAVLGAEFGKLDQMRTNWEQFHGNALPDATAMLAYVLQTANTQPDSPPLCVDKITFADFDAKKEENKKALCVRLYDVMKRLSTRSTSANKQGGFRGRFVRRSAGFDAFAADNGEGGQGTSVPLDGSCLDLMKSIDAPGKLDGFLEKVEVCIGRLNDMLPESTTGPVKLDTLLGVVGGGLPAAVPSSVQPSLRPSDAMGASMASVVSRPILRCAGPPKAPVRRKDGKRKVVTQPEVVTQPNPEQNSFDQATQLAIKQMLLAKREEKRHKQLEYKEYMAVSYAERSSSGGGAGSSSSGGGAGSSSSGGGAGTFEGTFTVYDVQTGGMKTMNPTGTVSKKKISPNSKKWGRSLKNAKKR